jgi:hypothetical protein
VDIREGSEFTLTFPYYSAAQYRYLADNSDGVYGYVIVRVINQLIAPDTVPQSVIISVEAFACDDLEFAVPQENTASSLLIVPESECDIITAANGAVQVRRSLAPAAHCIGEKILSVRSLMKRATFLYNKTQRDANSDWSSVIIHPWFLWSTSKTAAAINRGDFRSDNLSLLVAPFALFRGSMRVKILNNSQTDKNFISSLRQGGVGLAYFEPIQFSNVLAALTPYVIPNTEPVSIGRLLLTGAHEVEVPYYSRTLATPIVEIMGSNVVATHPSHDRSVPSSYVTAWLAGNTDFPARSINVFRSAGEDASASLFMSTVPLVDW